MMNDHPELRDPHRSHLRLAAAKEAAARYPDDVDPETGQRVDDWGYPECQRQAFIAGAEYAFAHDTRSKVVRDELVLRRDRIWRDRDRLDQSSVDYIPEHRTAIGRASGYDEAIVRINETFGLDSEGDRSWMN